jgi:hypothetical protein
MHGFSLAQQLREQALQQRAMQLNEQRDKRQAAVEDIATRLKLADAGAKPVSAAGTTQETMQLPNIDIAGRQFAGQQVSTNVPAPLEQTATYNGTNYFIPTREQRDRADLKSKIDEVSAIGNVQNQLAIDRLQKELNIPIGEIGGQQVTKGTAPYVEKKIEREFTAGENEKNRTAANQRNQDTIKSREKIEQNRQENENKRASIREAGENARNAASNASREKAAGIRRDSPTPGQQGVQGRFDQREVDQAQKQHNQMADQEQKLWSDRQKLGDMLKRGKTLDAKGNEIDINPTLAASMQQQIKDKEKLALELQKRQKAIRQRFGWGEFAPGGAGGGATPTAAPDNGNPYRRRKAA